MNVDKEVFAAYAFYAAVVTVKMVAMSFFTARQRFATGTFISSEDATRPGMKVGYNVQTLDYQYPFLDWSK